jgi:thrombospondin type 3 repeat protein
VTEVRNEPARRHFRLHPGLIRKQGLALAVLAAAGLSAAPLVQAFYQSAADASPESGTAQVVAQGVIDLGDGDLRWQVTDRVAQLPGNAEPIESEQGFVIVQSGVLLLEDTTSGNQYRLPAGEAALTGAQASQERVALGSDVASYHDVALVPSDDAVPADETVIYASEPFAGPGARHDVDLLQDALPAGGQWSLPAGSLPSLVLVDVGAADIATESGDVVSLGAGEAASFSGQVIITAGAEGAGVSVVEVGPAVPLLSQAAQTSQATPNASASVATPAARVIEVEGTATAVPVASPEAGDGQGGNDADGDGLNDRREGELGTDPSLADTDEDGLTDGAEVRDHDTNPLAADSDTDGVLDGDEVALGTDPNDPNNGAPADEEVPVAEEAPVAEEPAATVEEDAAPVEEAAVVEEVPVATAPGDTDGDGLEDAIEFELGTDPYTGDTDQDGLTDGDEYYVFATGTLNPDSDGDGILDGDEAAQGTDPNVFN